MASDSRAAARGAMAAAGAWSSAPGRCAIARPAGPRRSPRRGRRRRRPAHWGHAARRPRIEATLLALLAIAIAAGWIATRPAVVPAPGPPPARLSAAEARAANAAIPFAPGPVRPAARYRFRGSPAAREQAVRCLATAALYEAGDDARGQRAVMQVILNRLRRPGYPDTVCGVVYQGATLPTGCQFSFACDGSATRRPERAGWADARARAVRALAGAVYAPVGRATHYHADYVIPYWIGTLDKTARVGPHIFYRPHVGGGPRTPPPRRARGLRARRADCPCHGHVI